MATENDDRTVISAPVEGAEPAVEAVTPPAPAEGERVVGESSHGEPPAPSPAPPEAPKGAWPKSAVDRVAKLTARLREYEAKGPGADKPIDPGTGQRLTDAQIDQMINERATMVAAQRTFDSACNEAAQRGAGKYPDWQVRLNGITQLVDQADPRSLQNYNIFLQAALETGDPEGVIHRLGGNLEEAARVLNLAPVKMTMEVAKLVRAGPGEPSKAPKPIRPVGSSSPVNAAAPDDSDRAKEMDTAAWMKARNAQAKERGIR